MNTRTDPNQLFGYEVHDGNGSKIGTVDNVWIDDATSQLEFVGVKTGWLFGKSHVIPAEQAQIGDGQITVPYPESQIKDAPSFAGDSELSPENEDQIYSYYGMQRSTAPSPSGLGTGGPTQDAGIETTTPTDASDQARMTLSEEELQVGKRQVEAGQVRLRKVVKTERQEVPVDLRREEIHVERVPASGDTTPSDAFQEQDVTMTATREEPVIAKQAHVTDEVRVGKDVQTETQAVGGEVRKEDVDVQGDAGTTRDTTP